MYILLILLILVLWVIWVAGPPICYLTIEAWEGYKEIFKRGDLYVETNDSDETLGSFNKKDGSEEAREEGSERVR